MLVPRTVLLPLWLILGTATALPAAEWAEKMFEVKRHDFGRVPFGAKAEHPFVLTNVNPFDVEIARTRVSCECTKPEVSQKVLRPGEQATIVAGLNTKKYNGRKGATIVVTFSKPSYAEVQLHVTSFIDKKVEITPGSVELGSIDQGTAVQKDVTVSYSGKPGWRILKVTSGNPHLSAEVVETERTGDRVSYRLRARLAATAPGGRVNEHLVLVTNDRQSAEVPVQVQGLIRSEITVSPAVLLMGVAAPGKQLTKVFVLRGKRPFRILSLTCDAAGYEFAGVEAEGAKSLFLIRATFTAGTRPGKVSGTIRIRADLGQAACELPVQAVVKGL